MANELYKIEGWIPAMVAANASLIALVGARVFEGQAPQQTTTFNPFRCVIFALLNGATRKMMNGTRVMTSAEYKIVVAVEGDFTEDDYEAMNLLVATFEKRDTDVFEGNVFNSRLDDWFASDETDGRTGKRYKQKGGTFTVESYPNA